MCEYPKKVDLVEVGPRDGFQSESRVLSTQEKAEVIRGLLQAGMREIQVTSFVHPDKVPQLADAEDLLAALPRPEGVVYTVLSLNVKGVERALQSPADRIEVSLSLSDAHSRRNAGMSRERAMSEAENMLDLCRLAGRPARVSLQCAFGCVLEGIVPSRLVKEAGRKFARAGAEEIVLADTPGLADPLAVEELFYGLRSVAPGVDIALHLHDTRGLGLANALRALQLGVSRFDTSAGGMGGCPFHPGAAGNIPTEDTAYLCSRLGVTTDVDLQALLGVTQGLEALYHRAFPARIRPGLLASGNGACRDPDTGQE